MFELCDIILLIKLNRGLLIQSRNSLHNYEMLSTLISSHMGFHFCFALLLESIFSPRMRFHRNKNKPVLYLLRGCFVCVRNPTNYLHFKSEK